MLRAKAVRIVYDSESQICQLELNSGSASGPGNECFGNCVPTVKDSPIDYASIDFLRQISHARGGMLRKLE